MYVIVMCTRATNEFYRCMYGIHKSIQDAQNFILTEIREPSKVGETLYITPTYRYYIEQVKNQ